MIGVEVVSGVWVNPYRVAAVTVEERPHPHPPAAYVVVHAGSLSRIVAMFDDPAIHQDQRRTLAWAAGERIVRLLWEDR